MRVLMVTSGYLDTNIGGVESHVYELSRAMTRRGHEVAVARTGAGPSKLPHPADIGVTVLNPRPRSATARLPEPVRRVAGGLHAATFVRAIREYDPDVVHFHDFSESFPLAVAARVATRSKLVWTNHLGEFLVLARSRPGRLVSRLLTYPYSTALAPSRELALQAACSAPIAYVPNGFDPDRFHPPTADDRSRLRRRYGIDPRTMVALVPRRWAPNKGVRHLAEALCDWPIRDDRTALVVFAGGGSDRYPAYQRDVAGLLARSAVPVRVLGEVPSSQMPELLQLSDVTVIPSLREATSLSAIESLGCGVPVLGTTVGGLVDLRQSMCEGAMELVPPADPGALLRGLSHQSYRRAWDPAVAERLAKETAHRFSWAAVAEVVENAYLEVEA